MDGRKSSLSRLEIRTEREIAKLLALLRSARSDLDRLVVVMLVVEVVGDAHRAGREERCARR